MPRGKMCTLTEVRKELARAEKVVGSLRKKEDRLMEKQKQVDMKEVIRFMERKNVGLAELYDFIHSEEYNYSME